MSLWQRLRQDKSRTTNGCRIYAIGDVHGCFSLLVQLLQQIERDQSDRPAMETHVVMLGDYIDRGPQSRDVCELLQAMAPSPYFHCLRGNHEQVMLDVLDGNAMALQHWLQFGGVEALLSWGVAAELIEQAQHDLDSEAWLIEAFRQAVSPEMITWMRGLPSLHLHGDYLFVHAGIRPKKPLDEQHDDDLLWIREPFLSSSARHPWCVVHGHSQSEQIDIQNYRIGIDTGAYRTGILSAVGIEEDRHWTIQTAI